MNSALFQNSLFLSAAVTLFALTAGSIVALAFTAFTGRIRSVVLAAAAITLVLPPFLVTQCWIHLAGDTGLLKPWIPFRIYSIWGTIWILTLLHWPIAFFLVATSWKQLDRSLFECDSQLRGWQLIRWLLIPAARRSLGQSALLIFVLAFNHFSVPAILQTKVFPAELWVSFNTTFSYRNALILSLPSITVSILFLLWLRRGRSFQPPSALHASPHTCRQQLGPALILATSLATTAILTLSLMVPLLELAASGRTWSQLLPALAASRSAAFNSFWFAALTASLCSSIGLAFWRCRWAPFTWLMVFIPGIFLGLTLTFVFNRPWLNVVYQGYGIVILALTLRWIAWSWTGTAHAIQSIDPNLTHVALLNHASRWQLLRFLHWPQAKHSVLALWYVTYLLALWDVESLLFVVPPGGETLALRIFNMLHYGYTSQVNALCLVMIAIALLPAALWALSHPARVKWPLTLCGLLFLANCSPAPKNQSALNSQFFHTVQIIGTRGTGAGQFNKPRSLALDLQDNLYVVDMTGRVQKFSTNGAFVSSWQMPQTDKGKPKGMCRDHHGNIVVVEPHYARINHFSPAGQLVHQWGTPGAAPGLLTLPRDVAVNSAGQILLAEYTTVDRVQVFSPRGEKLLHTFGQPGTSKSEFQRAEGLATDDQNRIYVADSCNHRVQVFSADGTFLYAYGQAGNRPGDLSYPYDIAVDSEGFQFVCEFGNSRLQVFDPTGRPIEIIGQAGAAPGQFNNPWAVALDSQGNLYVADSQNHRVQKLVRSRSPKSPLHSQAHSPS